MSKFKAGDRVVLYHGDAKVRGQVDGFVGDGRITVTDDGGGHWDIHPQQCRRLVKKERRRVWVLKRRLEEADMVVQAGAGMTWPTDFIRTSTNYRDDPEYVEFVEVRRK